MPADPGPYVAVGQTWRHKRERWRRVKIRSVQREWTSEVTGHLYPERVQVDRNTSRRTQAIKVSTLRREYELVS